MIPPPPKLRIHGLWDDLDQARRAWAIAQACRLYSGLPGVLMGDVAYDADLILDYVTEPR